MGGAGAGKSTVARRLGEALDAPVIHLDRLLFGSGWTPVNTPTFRTRLAPLVAADAWVVDGTYGEVADLILGRADLTIWLDQPLWRRLWRSWRKTRIHRAAPRADRPDGCEERFGWAYVWQIISFGGWSKGLRERLQRASAGPVVRLRGDRAVKWFLACPRPSFGRGVDAATRPAPEQRRGLERCRTAPRPDSAAAKDAQ